MGTTNVIPCRGLATDANAVMPAPGALRRCENAIIDAPGVASARPNFSISSFSKTTSNDIRRVFAHDDALFALTLNGSTWAIERSAAVLTGDATPTDLTKSNMQVAKARLNAYFATDSGVRKISTASDASSAAAGMHEVGQVIIAPGGGGTWLAVNSLVAYRVCFVKRDANDIETRSAPSPWTYRANDSGGASGMLVNVALPPYAVAGDTLEVYRSKAVTSGTPSDVMYLVTRYTVQSADVTAGTIQVQDALAESQLGEVLYTSSTREGIEGENLRPPRSLALTTWNDSLWCGSTRAAHTLIVDLVAAWDAPPVSLSSCSVTTGSPTITMAGPRTDIRIGQMLITDSLSAFPAGARVTGFTATTVTMNANSVVTSGVAEFGWVDVVSVDGVEYYGHQTTTSTSLRRFRVWDVPGNPGASAFATARELAYVVSFHSSDIYARSVEDTSTDVTARTGRIVFQRTSLSSTSSFTFDDGSTPTTSWEAFSGSFTSEQETKPNRIAFSKPLEPEHFRRLDWIEMGREDAHVLGFAPLSGGLLVFKEDGIWSVYGTWPLFSVEKVSDAQLVRGDAVAVLDDRAYAWTATGVLEMTERGLAENLTAGRIRDELHDWGDEALSADFAGTAAGVWVVSWSRPGLVLVGANAVTRSRVYVFHTLTREWSMWPVPGDRASRWIGPYYDDAGDRLIYGRQGVSKIEVRESTAVEPRGYDATYSISTWSINAAGTLVTIAAANLGEWDPMSGDFVGKTESALARITAVETSGSNYLLTVTGDHITSGGTLSAYEGAPSVIEWQRHGLTPASVGGFVREMQIHLDLSDYDADEWPVIDTMRVLAGGSSDRSNTVSTLTATPTFETAHSRPLRFGIPRNITRRTHLYPYLEINELVRWRVLGIALVGDGVSERVRR